MFNVRILCTSMYIETNYSHSLCTIMYIGKKCSCYVLNPILKCKCIKFHQQKKQSCRLVTCLRQFTTFYSKNMGKKVLACMPPLKMIMCKLSSNKHCIIQGGRSGIGPNRDELRLCEVNQSNDSLQMPVVVIKLALGSSYTLRISHLEGEEVSRSIK